MSSVKGGRGGSNRGRGASPFGPAAGPKTTRSPFAPRARASNQVRFNAQPRGGGAAGAAAPAERGGRGGFRGAQRGRGKSTAPTRAPTQAGLGFNASSSHTDRFQALKKQREQERIRAIQQGVLADPDKPRTLAEAITPVGTCPDMCAEFERLERITQNDVWAAEKDDANNPVEHRMVKKFRRAAAGIDEQLPSDLRPPSVLKKTIDYLFDDMVANAPSLGSVHHFVWDRTRAIRNDFSIQQITKPSDVEIAIDCYERIARFHILSLHQLAVPEKPYDKYDWYQEREQLDRTLLSLMQYYDDSRGRLQCKNEAEFRAYLIIFQAQDPTPDLDERVNTWPLSIKSDRRVRVALDLNSAASNIVDPQGPLKPRAVYPVAREDWSQFFDLVRSNKVSYLMACVSEIYFKLVRRTALNAIWRGFKGQVHDFTLSLMTDLLAFDDEEQTETFCQHFGFTFKTPDSEGEAFLDLNSVQGKTLPQETPGLDHQTFSEGVVETKRMGRNFAAVIGGYTVADAQSSGLIDESYDSQMDDSQVEEDPDSLFVPEDPPKSVFGSTGASSSSPFANAFGPIKPVSESQPSSIFSQPQPTTSAFGKPSASTAFGFSKPSEGSTPHDTPTAPAISPSPSVFAQPPSTNTTTTSANPFSSPFSATKPATPAENASVEKPAEPSTSPFSFAKPSSVEDRDVQKPQVATTGMFGSPSSAGGAALWNDPAAPATNQPAATSSTPSLFQTSTTQESLPKPSFSFSSTSQPTAQSSIVPPAPSKSPFQFSPTADKTGTPSSPTKETVASASSPTSFFGKPTTASNGLPTFSSTPPAVASDDQAQKDATTTKSTFGSKPPSFSFSQPNQPKKPSPLSQSFSLPDQGEQAAPNSSVFAPGQPSSMPPTLKPFAAEQTPALPPPKPPKTKDEILEQLAREVVLDADRGLVRQFVEYHARQTVMSVYDELYMESIRELADTFRRETLSYRYGKRWREICWRRRLARQGRERRRRAKKDQSARELKRKLAAERNAVDDFLKSTSQAKNLGTTVNGSRNSRRDPGEDSTPADHNNDPASAEHLREHKRLKSDERNDQKTPARKQPAATPRSNFLGFSMLGSQNRPAISSTPSRSNYFRLKALGINPSDDTTTSTSQARKRLREESEETSTGASPPSKRSQTPPANIDDTTTVRPRSSTYGHATAKPLTSSVVGRNNTKAREEDEQLFARARAARQAMAESGAWYRSEIQKEETRRADEAARSLISPSMERARQAARLRSLNHASATGTATPDVPAYRMRESRFVPRENYNLAIEKARQKIESRSRSPSHMSSPATANSLLRSGEKRHAQPSSLFASLNGSNTQATDSMAQFTALHKAPENRAWQYESPLFPGSTDPALSEPGANGHVEPTPTKSSSEHSLASMKHDIYNDYVDLGSDDESMDVPQQGHSNGEVESTVNSEAYDDEEEEGEDDVGGYAQGPDEFEDEEGYDEEEHEATEGEEYDDYDEEASDEDEELTCHVLPPDNANTNIKAGTGTAEDAFELSD